MKNKEMIMHTVTALQESSVFPFNALTALNPQKP